MSDLPALFDNMPVESDVLREMQELNDKLAGGGGSYKRISIRGGKFRLIENGEQVSVSKENAMEIIVVSASPVVRQYYEGDYDAKADKSPPVCWSDDSNSHKPSKNVPEDQRMASSCNDCPKNVKGSGQGNSRACRFSQRLAVTLPGDLETIYQLSLPATSLFGEAERGLYPMQGYARLLKSHKMPISAVVTEMSFDEDSEVPKLFFKPTRPLNEDEMPVVLKVAKSKEAEQAVTMTVSQADGVQALPEAEAEDKPKAKSTKPKAEAKKEKPKAKVEDEEEDEVAKLKRQLAEAEAKATKPAAEEESDEPDEPTKVEKAKPDSEESGEGKLANILSGWDDDDDDEDDDD